MTLSILQCGGRLHGLFDSSKDKIILSGTLPEMEEWKHLLETIEQDQQNRDHFQQLREKYLTQLVEGGNSTEQATAFLKDRMPFLFQ